ncbi:MAG: acetyltransferase [Thermoanaerobaculia bacterium]
MKELEQRIRQAFVEAALLAYDDAGVQGLCAEGRWEAAVGALRSVELAHLLEPGSGTSSSQTAPEA